MLTAKLKTDRLSKLKTDRLSTGAKYPDMFRSLSFLYDAEHIWLSRADDRRFIRTGLSESLLVEVYVYSSTYQKTFANKTSAITDQIRLTGPIQFLVKLLKTWNLSRADAIPLLGLEDERAYAKDLLAGRARLRGRDLKHRIACLFRIRKTLYALFRDEKVENDWLREPHDALDGQRPMDVMLEGSMENLLLVKEYVEEAAGL